MIEIDNIYNMDCIEGMKLMANGSVDAVIADLPYGVLNRSNKAVHWDRQIPLEALWEQYRRITKPGSPVILFAQGGEAVPGGPGPEKYPAVPLPMMNSAHTGCLWISKSSGLRCSKRRKRLSS